MDADEIVLCAASAYEEKYYLNENFKGLPTDVKKELQIMCTLFTMDVGGIIELVFDEEGKLFLRTECDEGDLLYDDIGSVLKVKELQREKEELFEQLQMYLEALKKGILGGFETAGFDEYDEEYFGEYDDMLWEED